MTKLDPPKRTLYLMGGLPKSGTSAVAGALYACGLPMEIDTSKGHEPLIAPTTAPESQTDKKYYMYESLSVMRLNEQILSGVISGFEWRSTLVCPGYGSMMNPPHPDCIYQDGRTYSMATYILSMIPTFPFGMKDPRFGVVFGTWKKILEATNPEINVVPIFSVREPLAGAQALVRRGWMPSMDSALELWLRFNRNILRWHEKFDAKVIIFDQSTEYLGQIDKLVRMMNLDFNEEQIKEFYKPSEPSKIDGAPLRNHLCRASIEEVYGKLLEGRLK